MPTQPLLVNARSVTAKLAESTDWWDLGFFEVPVIVVTAVPVPVPVPVPAMVPAMVAVSINCQSWLYMMIGNLRRLAISVV